MKKARSEMKQNALLEKLKKEIYPAVQKDVEESMMMILLPPTASWHEVPR